MNYLSINSFFYEFNFPMSGGSLGDEEKCLIWFVQYEGCEKTLRYDTTVFVLFVISN